MIKSNDFIWGHIPKTGGDITWALFMLFPEMINFAHHPCHYKEKHGPLKITNKDVILNFRRLPQWLLSQAHQYHAIKRAIPSTPPIKGMADKYVKNRKTGIIHTTDIGDSWIEYVLNGNKITHWMRVEHIEKDFIEVMSNYIKITDDHKEIIKKILYDKNIRLKPEQHYNRNIYEWFTEAEIQEMYDKNPEWKKIESELYHSSLGKNNMKMI